MVAPQVAAPPKGSITLAELRRRLTALACKKYGKFGRRTNETYVLVALEAAFKAYGTSDFPFEKLWDRILLGEPCGDTYVLPDTEEARNFHREFAEKAIILTGVADVQPLLVTILINTILKWELKPDLQEWEIIANLKAENSPSRRQHKVGNGSESHSLDEYLHSIQKEREEAVEKALDSIIEQIFSTMSDRDVSIIESLFMKKRREEIARNCDLTKWSIDKIWANFRKELYKRWAEAEERHGRFG